MEIYQSKWSASNRINTEGNSLIMKFSPVAVHAKPRLSQVNVRQKLYATGRNFGFTCHKDR